LFGGFLDNDNDLIPEKGNGFFDGISLRVKLIYRLLLDRRVNLLIKILPVGALAYFIIPDILPGPIDDAMVIWIGGTLFVELCPPNIVQEHMDALRNVIDGEWRELDE
jgi:hypothetical protein